jgi:hypothetical protein
LKKTADARAEQQPVPGQTRHRLASVEVVVELVDEAGAFGSIELARRGCAGHAEAPGDVGDAQRLPRFEHDDQSRQLRIETFGAKAAVQCRPRRAVVAQHDGLARGSGSAEGAQFLRGESLRQVAAPCGAARVVADRRTVIGVRLARHGGQHAARV